MSHPRLSAVIIPSLRDKPVSISLVDRNKFANKSIQTIRYWPYVVIIYGVLKRLCVFGSGLFFFTFFSKLHIQKCVFALWMLAPFGWTVYRVCMFIVFSTIEYFVTVAHLRWSRVVSIHCWPSKWMALKVPKIDDVNGCWADWHHWITNDCGSMHQPDGSFELSRILFVHPLIHPSIVRWIDDKLAWMARKCSRSEASCHPSTSDEWREWHRLIQGDKSVHFHNFNSHESSFPEFSPFHSMIILAGWWQSLPVETLGQAIVDDHRCSIANNCLRLIVQAKQSNSLNTN